MIKALQLGDIVTEDIFSALAMLRSIDAYIAQPLTNDLDIDAVIG